MSASIVSTYSLGATSLAAMSRAQNELTTLTEESSSGQYADLGVQLGEQSGYELSLRSQVNQLQAFTAANTLTVTNLQTAQTAIDAVRSTAQSAVKTLTSLTGGATTTASTLATTGTNSLKALISAMNSTSDGQYVFGGENSGQAPIADYFSSTVSAAKSSIDAAFYNEFGCNPTDPAAANITGTQMQSFLDGSFSTLFSGASWTSDWSSASDVNVTTQIAPGESVDSSTNANQPGFQQLAQAYAMMTEFGGSSLGANAQQAIISSATSLINQGLSSLTTTEATLGASQSRVTDASTAMSNQLTILQTQIGNLDNVDSQKIATELSTVQTQLQTAYQLTAQLQKLNLAQYL